MMSSNNNTGNSFAHPEMIDNHLEHGIVENPQVEHIPLMFVIDRSGSTVGEPNRQINDALDNFIGQLWSGSDSDEYLRRRLDMCVITYGGDVQIQLPFTNGDSIKNFTRFDADGLTPMGKALRLATEEMKKQLAAYRSTGTQSYTGLIFNLTDGAPTDMSPNSELWNRVQSDMDSLENVKGSGKAYAKFFHVGCDGADMELLDSLGPRAAKMDGFKYHEFIKWVRLSLDHLSRSRPGDTVTLPARIWEI